MFAHRERTRPNPAPASAARRAAHRPAPGERRRPYFGNHVFWRAGAGDRGGKLPPEAGGRPLSPGTRAYMEPRFGADFSGVRLHTGAEAERTASRLGARAFTYGREVWLGRGADEGDRRLMAHELAHVVQQAAGGPASRRVMRTVENCGDRTEEAEENVARARKSAVLWARNAAELLKTPDRAASLLRRHFGISATQKAEVAFISDTFDTLARHLAGGLFSYYCRPDSDPRCQDKEGKEVLGFASHAGGYAINFCDPYPFQDFFGHRSLIDLLLHEAAHAHKDLFSHDTYEFEADYPPDDALTNADSYASFARDAALGISGYGFEIDFSLGGVLGADPRSYAALGLSVAIGGPVLDLLDLRTGIRAGLMEGTERQPERWFLAGDLGLRIAPLGEPFYLDLATGAFYGTTTTDPEFLAGIASHLTAGYHGEQADLGLELSHLYDAVGDENFVLLGIRSAARF